MAIDLGNRVFKNIERADRKIVDAFKDIPSSNINDMMNRLFCMRSSINRIGKVKNQLIGTAVTVKVPDGDNVMIHIAMDLCKEGDVLVIDGNGCTTRSLMGEFMFLYCQQKKLGGIIVDGAIRDWDSLNELDIPVYAAAITPQGPYKNGLGEVNVPVACGGQVVYPGDILVGDADGVVVIHKEDAPLIIEASRAKYEMEQEDLIEYNKGNIGEAEHWENYSGIAARRSTAFYD